MSTVLLECVRLGSKLKVKMRSHGYIWGANCQFPRALRVAGRRFEVDADAVKLMQGGGTYFYSVKDRNKIRIIDEDGTVVRVALTVYDDAQNDAVAQVALPAHVYEDTDTSDCVVCMCAAKTTVFVPCGHFYTCHECSSRLTSCPICRTDITHRIDKGLVDV